MRDQFTVKSFCSFKFNVSFNDNAIEAFDKGNNCSPLIILGECISVVLANNGKGGIGREEFLLDMDNVPVMIAETGGSVEIKRKALDLFVGVLGVLGVLGSFTGTFSADE